MPSPYRRKELIAEMATLVYPWAQVLFDTKHNTNCLFTITWHFIIYYYYHSYYLHVHFKNFEKLSYNLFRLR
jgi:hypothetical protein